MHCDSSYAVLFAAEIEQRVVVLAAHRLGLHGRKAAEELQAIFSRNSSLLPIIVASAITLKHSSVFPPSPSTEPALDHRRVE
jgi:hypothetical protein